MQQLIVLLTIFLSGCNFNWILPSGTFVTCTDNDQCPEAYECNISDGGTRVCVDVDGQSVCGDGVVSGEEVCDNGSNNTTEYYQPTAAPGGSCNTNCDGFAPHCGDGLTNGSEACDDGAANTDIYGTANSCNLKCTGLAPHCGDGVVNGGEACDFGAANSDTYGNSKGCLTSCSGPPNYCGDGLTNGSEACDDGNTSTSDYCSEDCLEVTTVCGDGQVQGNEICDDGDQNTSNAYLFSQTCNDTCTGYVGYCGDNIENGNEACDDGNTTAENNGCSSDCQRIGSCSDGVIQYYFEDCDDGNSLTESCSYGEQTCVVCVGAGYTDVTSPGNSSDGGCEYREVVGAYCGDGIVQQRGLVGGTTMYTNTASDGENTSEWEGCDNAAPIACSELHPKLGTGTAVCQLNCQGYDTSGCSNQEVVFVPRGPFMMGCNQAIDLECDPHEGPYHEVFLDDYVIDKLGVTAGSYRSWCEDSDTCVYDHDTLAAAPVGVPQMWENCWCPYYQWFQTYDNDRDDHPINFMSYNDATAYCTAKNMSLPTEAQREKAARGTDGRIFPWGFWALPTCERAVMFGWLHDPDDPNATVDGWIWGEGCGKNTTWAVGSMPAGASPYGVMDMAGNVQEWVSDWYASSYYIDPAYENPVGPHTGSYRVLRGGSFRLQGDQLRGSKRTYELPTLRSATYGFRCAK